MLHIARMSVSQEFEFGLGSETVMTFGFGLETVVHMDKSHMDSFLLFLMK